MAILAEIRKRPIYLILIIGMALFAFVIGGIFTGDNGPTRISIGSVNGEEISTEKFSRQLERQNNGRSSSLQSVNTVWNNMVREQVYNTQIDKAGIVIGEKDIWDDMVANSSNQKDTRFLDESGLFDENKLKEYVATIKDNRESTQQGRAEWANWVNYERLTKARLEQITYDNLVRSGLTASLKEGERTYLSENTSANIQYVYEPYTTIKDTDVQVTDTEITNYMNSHAAAYKVDASTEVDFVKFEVKPSNDDVASVKAKITSFINDRAEYNPASGANDQILGFANTKDIKGYVNTYSDTPYVDKLYLESDLPANVYADLSGKSAGGYFGPYRDGDYFKIAKIIDKNGIKSAKSSHVLIAYVGATRAKPTVTRTREEAQAFAKTIFEKINSKNFVDLAKENSDGSSASKGGDIGWFDEKSGLAEEYKDFIFGNKKGKIKLVESSFGFHIIRIDDLKTEAGLNLGIITKKIDASDQTESKIYQAAETLASDLTSGKKLLDLAKEGNYRIQTASNMKKFDEKVGTLGSQREIVKWSFDKETNVGNVKRFDLDNGDYAVVVLKTKNLKGLMPMTDARLKVSPILLKQKKAVLIREKMNGSSIDDIAKSVGKSINTADNISVSNPLLKIGGRDLNIVGALLYMNEGDVKVVDGTSGVYAFKILKKTTPYALKKFDTYANTITKKLKSRSNKVYDAIKGNSEIEDNRAVFY